MVGYRENLDRKEKHMNKILLVEDDISLIDGLKYSLRKQEFDVEVVRTVEDAKKQLIYIDRYDLIILDVTLPDGTGFDICERVRKRNKYIPIIFLTASDEEVNVIRGLDCGGDDYVTKPFNPIELIARVNALIRRYTKLGSSIKKSASGSETLNIIQDGELIINDELKQVIVDDKEVKLTPTEYNILKFLTKNKGKVFSIEEIYTNVWDGECYAAENVIAVHIRHIREKIEINPKEPKYLKVIWGIGYKVEAL